MANPKSKKGGSALDYDIYGSFARRGHSWWSSSHYRGTGFDDSFSWTKYANIRADDFEKGTQTAVSTLSGEASIQVVFGGAEIDVSRCDKITLPQIDPTDGISRKDANIIRGFADREILKRRVSKLRFDYEERNAEKDHLPLFKVIDDVRIDKAGTELYHGTKDNIEATLNKVADELNSTILLNPAYLNDIEKLAPAGILLAGHKAVGYDVTRYNEIFNRLNPLDRNLLEEIGKRSAELQTGVISTGATDATASCKGMYGAEDLAKEAKELIELRAEEQRMSPPPDEGKSEMRSAKGSDAGEGELNTGEGELNISFEETAKKIFDRNIAGNFEGKYKPGMRIMDVFLTPEDILKRISGGGGKTTSAGIEECRSRGLTRANAVLKTTASSLAVMKTNLERLLMSKQLEAREEVRGGGKLNRRRLIEAFNLSDNVFLRKADDVAIDTAVQLVVDLSGSMSGAKMVLATRATILLSEALQKCGVPFEIVGFNTVGNNMEYDGPGKVKSRATREAIRAFQEAEKTHRHDSIEMWYFKPFALRYQMCLPAIGNMCSGGSNCDAESILYASESLLKRPERKKIMMVLSDGQPAFGYSGDCDHSMVMAHLIKTIKGVEKNGVYVIGIGIEDHSVKAFYDRNIVIKNVEELPKAVLTEVGRAIL